MDIKMEDDEHNAGLNTSAFRMDSVNNTIQEIAGIPVAPLFNFNLMSVDDYLKENVPPQGSGPGPSITSSKKPATLVTQGSLSSEGGDAVVVSQSRNTQYPRLLNEYITSNHPGAIKAEYIYTERVSQRFSVLLRFDGPGYNDIEPEYEERDGQLHPKEFGSKKHAKEAAAGCALEYLKSLPVDPQTINIPQSIRGEENPAGLLNTWCSKMRLDPPLFTDYESKSLPHQYGCILKLPIADKTFGDGRPMYQNKKIARNVVARAAMDWIKTTNPPLPDNHQNNQKPHVLSAGAKLRVDATGKSPGQLCGEICPWLGFKGPKFELEKKPECVGMVDVYCILEHVQGLQHQEDKKIGPLKNQYGQKNAKEQMAKALLEYLKIHAEQVLHVNLEIVGTIEFSPLER